MQEKIIKTLRAYRSGRLPIGRAVRALKELPYADLGFAKVDHHRGMRRGFPEVIFGQGKTVEHTVAIARKIIEHDGILLITRTTKAVYRELKRRYPGAAFDEEARIVTYRAAPPPRKSGTVLIVTAGTADLPVAREARATLEIMGDTVEMLCDVGVAGIHRVLGKRAVLERAAVVIVIAGMEGALASVVSGLVSRPVIAVPTSVGYGASFAGLAPLLTMMNSCSPGVAVVNIDNGFGAGYLASMINR